MRIVSGFADTNETITYLPKFLFFKWYKFTLNTKYSFINKIKHVPQRNTMHNSAVLLNKVSGSMYVFFSLKTVDLTIKTLHYLRCRLCGSCRGQSIAAGSVEIKQVPHRNATHTSVILLNKVYGCSYVFSLFKNGKLDN